MAKRSAKKATKKAAKRAATARPAQSNGKSKPAKKSAAKRKIGAKPAAKPKPEGTKKAAQPVEPKPRKFAPGEYEKHRAAMGESSRRRSATGRDIGPIPPVANPERRKHGSSSLRAFCETYLAGTFSLDWSPAHLTALAEVERVARGGGLKSLALPRGYGKTSICEAGALFAMLTGMRRYTVLIGATEPAATQMLDSIKGILETTEELLEDFPEVCYPIVSLEGISQRAIGQTCEGERTHIGWSTSSVVLPTIPGSVAAGARLDVAGITGAIRGRKHRPADGRPIRPDYVIIDDPQTDETARSLSQSQQRERVILGAVLGLAGPKRRISVVMPCTVIQPGDLADRFLDRKLHPLWRGERHSGLVSMPSNDELWNRYADILRESLITDPESDGAAATAFYAENREAMDAGAEALWPEKFEPHELSAIQSCMNLRIRDEASFWAETQNRPLSAARAVDTHLDADELCQRINGLDRGVIPRQASHLTAFCDVHDSILYWKVVAWAEGFTGWEIDYGTMPDQQIDYFTHRTVKRTLRSATKQKGVGVEELVRAGLDSVAALLLDRDWTIEGGETMRIQRMLIDAGDGQFADVIYDWCRATPHSAVVSPSHGKFVGAMGTPFSEYKRRPGERVGLNWRMPSGRGGRVRGVNFDANWWKTTASQRLSVPMGVGGITLFGRTPERHRMTAEHYCAERSTVVEARGRKVHQWSMVQVGRDNHLWDCLVGAMVAGSIEGVTLPAVGGGRMGGKAKRAGGPRRRMSEMRARR